MSKRSYAYGIRLLPDRDLVAVTTVMICLFEVKAYDLISRILCGYRQTSMAGGAATPSGGGGGGGGGGGRSLIRFTGLRSVLMALASNRTKPRVVHQLTALLLCLLTCPATAAIEEGLVELKAACVLGELLIDSNAQRYVPILLRLLHLLVSGRFRADVVPLLACHVPLVTRVARYTSTAADTPVVVQRIAETLCLHLLAEPSCQSTLRELRAAQPDAPMLGFLVEAAAGGAAGGGGKAMEVQHRCGAKEGSSFSAAVLCPCVPSDTFGHVHRFWNCDGRCRKRIVGVRSPSGTTHYHHRHRHHHRRHHPHHPLKRRRNATQTNIFTCGEIYFVPFPYATAATLDA